MHKAWLSVVVGAVAVGSAGADFYEFVFRGTIESTGGAAPAPIEVGDAFEFRYRFDTNWPDSDGAPNVGHYTGAVYVSWVTIGAESWHQTFPGDIFVLNDGFAGDSYNGSAASPVSVAVVSMTNIGGGAFGDDALPTDLNLSDWGIRNFTFQYEVGPAFWSATGDITGFESLLVPAPGALAMGAGMLLVRRRRR